MEIIALLLFLFSSCVCFLIFKESEESLGKATSLCLALVFVILSCMTVFPDFLESPHELTDSDNAKFSELCQCKNYPSYETEVDQTRVILFCVNDTEKFKISMPRFDISKEVTFTYLEQEWC